VPEQTEEGDRPTMTAEQLLSAAASPARPAGEGAGPPDTTVGLIRSSFARIEPHSEELGRRFYAALFARSPQARAMFPVNMQVQRSRLLRALVHVVQMVDRPDDLVPFLQQLGRDHRKFGVLAEHYDAVGAALLEALAALAGPAWTAEVEGAWAGAYGTVAEAMRAAAAADPGPASWAGEVLEHRRIGWDLAVLRVRTEPPVRYLAGQYVSVEVPQRPRLWRSLSPATAPRADGVLEFHVRAVRGGWVSRALVAHAAVGDVWRIGPPMGHMHVPAGSRRDLLLVAGGTGYAPIRAIVEDLAGRPEQPRTQVFLGGRTRADLYDLDGLRELSYRHPWLDVVPVVEQDPDDGAQGDGVQCGTLADVVPRYGAWADHDVLVCGSPAMVRSTVAGMLVAGTPLDRIRYDPFTVDGP
jgi:NAD(P)H-flavin reductase/hemoglobin-like flavoprotein